MQWIRDKFGGVVVVFIIGFIALVFIFYGVFSPRSTRGFHEGAVAGTVNGDPISVKEYQQSLNQRIESFRKMAGGKVSDELLKQLRVNEQVFKGLVERKVLIQEADKLGLEASDEEVKERILEMPYFQKNGKFDLLTYKQMLEANAYSPGSFERVVRSDLSAQRLEDVAKSRVQVSNEEAKRQYMLDKDTRNLKYVVLTTETGRKGVVITPDEAKKYLTDPAKMNLVRSNFDSKRETQYKGRKFEDVQDSIAQELLTGEKLPEIQKINEKLADQIVGLLKADKGSDAKVDAVLKAYGASVKTTGVFSHKSPNIPGIGDAAELTKDAFAAKSPIDPNQGGAAKKYSTLGGHIVIAVLTEVHHPDLAQFEAEREDYIRQLSVRKQNEFYRNWVNNLMQNAKVDVNQDVVGSRSES